MYVQDESGVWVHQGRFVAAFCRRYYNTAVVTSLYVYQTISRYNCLIHINYNQYYSIIIVTMTKRSCRFNQMYLSSCLTLLLSSRQ